MYFRVDALGSIKLLLCGPEVFRRCCVLMVAPWMAPVLAKACLCPWAPSVLLQGLLKVMLPSPCVGKEKHMSGSICALCLHWLPENLVWASFEKNKWQVSDKRDIALSIQKRSIADFQKKYSHSWIYLQQTDFSLGCSILVMWLSTVIASQNILSWR